MNFSRATNQPSQNPKRFTFIFFSKINELASLSSKYASVAEYLKIKNYLVHEKAIKSTSFSDIFTGLFVKPSLSGEVVWFRAPGIRLWLILIYIISRSGPERKCKYFIEFPAPLSVEFRRWDFMRSPVLLLEFTLLLIVLAFCRQRLNLFYLQYGDEGGLFKFLLGPKRQREVANPLPKLDFCRIASRRRPHIESKSLNFLFLGDLGYWHGLDRLIKGIADYRTSNNKEINLFCVGSVEAFLNNLPTPLPPWVYLKSSLTGNNLSEFAQHMHLGVGALGVHRLGLRRASPLKEGYYCSIGLPFICSHEDRRFPDSPCFRFVVPASDEPLAINMILQWLAGIGNNAPADIHAYALDRLKPEILYSQLDDLLF